MEFEKISEKAFKKEELGDYKNIAEKYAYLQMFLLYRNFENELISKENATKEKNKIRKEYELNIKKVNDYYDVFKKQNKIRIEYEHYLHDIEKTTELDDLLIKALKLLEIIIQDNSFFDRNYKKIKNS